MIKSSKIQYKTPYKKRFKNTTTIHPIKTGELSVVIVAAGIGSRMKSYGAKCLIQLTPNDTVLSRQLKLIQKILSPKEIILIVGHDAIRVMNKSPDNLIKIENERFLETNVIRSIGMGLRAATTTNIVVIYGDLVFSNDALKFPRSHSLVLIDNNTMNDDEVGCTVCNNELEYIFYELPNKWGQITFFTGKELELLKSISWNPDKYKFFGFEAINEIINRGGRFEVYQNKNVKVVDLDKPCDILKAQQLIK